MNSINLITFSNLLADHLVEKGLLANKENAMQSIPEFIEQFIPELKNHVKNYKDSMKPSTNKKVAKKATEIVCDKNDAAVMEIVVASQTTITDDKKAKRSYKRKVTVSESIIEVSVNTNNDELKEEEYI